MGSTLQEVIIIGGSLTGLFTAITVKSLPNVSKVTILERYQEQDLQDLGAGIRCNQEANDAISQFAGIPPSNYATMVYVYRFFDKDGNVAREQETATWTTSWGQLYRALRDNVDADSKCSYHHGCTLVNLAETKDGKMAVEYRGPDDQILTVSADVVVGADGASSTVRSLLDPAGNKRISAGYVCYRGVVPEDDISPSTAKTFEAAATFAWPLGSQFVSYSVPSNDMTADKAKKCVNWVWYQQKTDEELRKLMTDTSGKLHKFSLPQGKMKLEEIKKINKEAKGVLPPICAEIMEETKEPFVQVVTDSMASGTSFFDGKLVLVGDAVGGQRPHTASAILQGSYHAILVRQYLEGQLEATKLEEKTMKMSRILVDGGQELGKLLMNSTPPEGGVIPAFARVFLRIQVELNELWKQTIGIGDSVGKI